MIWWCSRCIGEEELPRPNREVVDAVAALSQSGARDPSRSGQGRLRVGLDRCGRCECGGGVAQSGIQ